MEKKPVAAPDPQLIAQELDALSFEDFIHALGSMGQAIEKLPDLLAGVDLEGYPSLSHNLKRWAYAELARAEDTPDAFYAFYYLIYGRKIPRHAVRWIEEIYAAKKDGRGVVIEAFRGSTKTTTLTNAFAAFRIGKAPHTTNLLIQVGDDIAQDNTAQIASIIEHHPGWSLVFPNVVPDKERGWGAGGYNVKRSDLDYAGWKELTAGQKDPTLIGVGYKSGEIIGKHPTGFLMVDDIHNEINTSSEREMFTVIKILTGTIFPTITEETWTVFVGTPWKANDTLAYVKATNEFASVRTPVFDEDGSPIWPEKFPVREIERLRRIVGELEFARMYLLDLEAAKGLNLRGEWLHLYPASQINPSWPVVFGIDYASTQDKLKNLDRDFFSLAILRAIPGGGLVLIDGYRGRISKGEALDVVLALWGIYPTLMRIGVENIGKGEEFYNDLALLVDAAGRVPPIIPITHGKRSKGERFEKWLGPRFQYSRIWVSDAETPWLRSFKNQWLSYPNGDHDDDIDAVYMGAAAGEGFLAGTGERTAGEKKKKKKNPFTALGRQ